MKNMVLFLLCIIYHINLFAQNNDISSPIFGCPKVYYTSQEVANRTCDSQLSNVNRSIFGGPIKVTYKNGHVHKIPVDSVWGYRAKNVRLTRIVKGYDYEVIQTSPVFIYRHISGHNYIYGLYSTSLDSPIYSFKHLQETNPEYYKVLQKNKAIKKDM